MAKGREGEQAVHSDFQGCETSLYDAINDRQWHDTSVPPCDWTGVNPDGNQGLWALMHPHRFIGVTNVPSGGGRLCMCGDRGTWEISLHFPQFCHEHKTALKSF